MFHVEQFQSIGLFLNGRRFLGISASALKLPMFLFHVEHSQLGPQTMELIRSKNSGRCAAPVDVPRETTLQFHPPMDSSL
jgi:hypothetical protein